MTYDIPASPEAVRRAADALEARNVIVQLARDRAEALQMVRDLIPAGSEVMTGASQTLDQIGFTELLKSGTHPWRNLKTALLAETDPLKQALLRRQATLAEYFLGSVHAIAETGEVVIASASGSQIPSYASSSPHVIWVAGTQKIVPTLQDAIQRVREYVLPLEDKRMKAAGAPGSLIAKLLVFEREAARKGRVTLMLVNEKLGF
jgi:L-lactate utilization protein LutC